MNVEFFRACEITLRRQLNGLEGADSARQKADAVELHGKDVLPCEVPWRGRVYPDGVEPL